jgi:hypothetical protein
MYFCIILCLAILVFAHDCPQPPTAPMQSVMDKQQELVDLGHDIAVDGKLGPETQAAWDSAWDNENFGNEVFE